MYESSAFQDETVPHQQYNTLVQVYRTRRRQILSHFETRIECSLSVICDITVKKTQTRTRRAPLYSKMPRLVLQNNFGNRTYDLSSKTNFVPVISLSVELGQLILANCYKCVSLNLTSLVNCAGLFFYFIYSVSNFEFYFYFYFHITVCGTRCLALRGNLGSWFMEIACFSCTILKEEQNTHTHKHARTHSFDIPQLIRFLDN
ncbi:hypothetical protein J3Q64DRAFT_1721616 [Phycomyces blakesleeanus]|uniref:C2H2-type zinc finger transcription factor n=1 Tax=Phycomyces blakesleeanus TaxID=4837 RepID=A0ABR3B9U6_PHYBL